MGKGCGSQERKVHKILEGEPVRKRVLGRDSQK